MEKVASLTRWDIIVGSDDVIVFIDPSRPPLSAGWDERGIFLNLGERVFHLAESLEAIDEVRGSASIIVVEADEITSRITRIPIARIGDGR